MYSPHLAPSTRNEMPPSLGLAGGSPTLNGLFAPHAADMLEPGEALFWEGDRAGHVFHVLEGCLRLYRVLPDGRRAVMGFVFAGEFLGLSLPGSYIYTAEAVTTVRVRRLSRSRFLAAVDETPELRPQLLARMCEEMSAAHQHLVVLGQLRAEERVISFLLSAARRTGADRRRPVAVELPMSRLDIADYLGLTIETVCRTISKLKRGGLIALEGRHILVLKRLDRLKELAGLTDDIEDGHAELGRAAWAN